MKKIALILALLLILCLAVCSCTKPVKEGESVTVTDENGNAVTDENGEVVTTIIPAGDTTADPGDAGEKTTTTAAPGEDDEPGRYSTVHTDGVQN